MKRKAFFNIAASSMIVASTMVGCSGAALNSRAGTSAGKMEEMAASQARGVEQALAKRDAGKAIQLAEAAVAASPQSAEYRTLLGRSYLMSGRFDSARTALEDALTLGGTDSRTIVNLALIHVAQGRNDAAQELLTARMAQLSAADYGLAMAMAGNPNEAIRILSQAIHEPTAGAKERQNLAYSYALAGQWIEARQMASVDLAPLDAAKRVMGWAQLAHPGAESQRVIAMMGVSPRADDAGLPVRLALAPDAPAQPPVEMATAAAEMQPIDEPYADAIPAPIEVAQAEVSAQPEPVMQEPVKMASVEADAAPIAEFVPASRQPVREAAASGTPLSPMLRPTPAPMLKVKIPAPTPVSIWRPVNVERGSSWVVQLGAFSSAERAQTGWTHYVRGNEKLGLFPLVKSAATVNGRQFHRVAIAGFGDKAGADRLCARIRADGGQCFVRQGGSEAAPSRWALAEKPRLLAMR